MERRASTQRPPIQDGAHEHDTQTVRPFSPGDHYLITENLEIGVRVGWGLNEQSARFFSNAGLGWRF